MRKIILSMMLSLDSYIEAPGNDIDWHVWDDEMEDYMLRFFETVDTIVLGRKTYELMVGYWPSARGELAHFMNETPKIVFSRTLQELEWNSSLRTAIDPEEINQLKQQSGKNLVIFGGADLATAFIENNLIDEYQLIINPVALGNGTPLFKNLPQQCSFKLTKAKVFNCGNVLLHYQPA
ncbi:dihydrofolate reductase family protein [Pedobacter immunditicola]|uniref:dihydrofolate reductase family protein n=1 Tax=Pedobacter immunditicola TaxID=3133440 RepID=UPI0030B1E1CC